MDSLTGTASPLEVAALGRLRLPIALEDQKHDEAQAWAEPTVRLVCERLVQAL